MKENTKYHKYRFTGKINVDEIQPWFDFGTARPWDDPEIPWVLDNKVKREILTILSNGPKTFDEINDNMCFSPKPLLITQEEYQPNVHYQWTRETIKNHLLNLEWYHLISLKDKKYELAFPFLNFEDNENLDQRCKPLAKQWAKIIEKNKHEFNKLMQKFGDNSQFYNILIEKTVSELFLVLKENSLIPDEPNIKALWMEQLRKAKFEDWIRQNY